MPPSAIASSVRRVISSSPRRRRNSSTGAGGELRRAAPTAPPRVEARREILLRVVEQLQPSAARCDGRSLAPERMCSVRSALERSTSPRCSRHASATPSSTCLNEGRPCRGSGGKYVPPKNGSPAGVRKTVIGQPPLPGQRDDRVHVDRVEVGTLLAVDLHVHEVLVHHARRERVLERLVLHHVAPVACRVADREQDRPVLRHARASSASSPHGYQSTGFSACCSR